MKKKTFYFLKNVVMSRSILFLNVLLLLFNGQFIIKQTGRSKQISQIVFAHFCI